MKHIVGFTKIVLTQLYNRMPNQRFAAICEKAGEGS